MYVFPRHNPCEMSRCTKIKKTIKYNNNLTVGLPIGIGYDDCFLISPDQNRLLCLQGLNPRK